jgi:hypothetical protein
MRPLTRLVRHPWQGLSACTVCVAMAAVEAPMKAEVAAPPRAVHTLCQHDDVVKRGGRCSAKSVQSGFPSPVRNDYT